MNGLILLAAASETGGMFVLFIGLGLLVLGGILAYQARQARQTYQDALAQLDAERAEFERTKSKTKSEPKPKKSKKAEPKKAKKAEPKKDSGPSKEEARLQKSLDDARGQIDKLKLKSHEQGEELKTLRARDKAAREAKPEPVDQDALFDLRQELGEAMAQIETYKSQLAEANSGRKRRKDPEPEPEPVKAEEPKKKPEPKADAEGGSDVDVDAIHSDYKSQLANLEREKDSLERDLRGKLKRSARDIDRQRGRADNNDKAYKITQRELDAARERISLLEDELIRARFPDGRPAPEPEAPAEPEDVTETPAVEAEAPAEEVVETTEAPVEETTEETTEEAEAVEAAPQAEEAEVADEVPADEPSEEAVEETTEEVADASATAIDDEIKRKMEEGLGGLGNEVSGVDEAWGDIDLDLEEE